MKTLRFAPLAQGGVLLGREIERSAASERRGPTRRRPSATSPCLAGSPTCIARHRGIKWSRAPISLSAATRRRDEPRNDTAQQSRGSVSPESAPPSSTGLLGGADSGLSPKAGCWKARSRGSTGHRRQQLFPGTESQMSVLLKWYNCDSMPGNLSPSGRWSC